jgi:hypothetical protein
LSIRIRQPLTNAFDPWRANILAGGLGQHREWIHQDLELGVQGIFLHKELPEFIANAG